MILQVPHFDWLQRLVPVGIEDELWASCWTLTSFFLSEEPVLLTKLKRDFFFVGGADCNFFYYISHLACRQDHIIVFVCKFLYCLHILIMIK